MHIYCKYCYNELDWEESSAFPGEDNIVVEPCEECTKRRCIERRNEAKEKEAVEALKDGE